ncbi:uncharacterized protein M6B38_290280 [Iris pallida]|uniref:Uncharacterized protein n=1 Tax=Iris pallida TaxID=29817 RepID=A0AAX6HVZ5_IRIPA|nr:uncharacterized protein M6B38_290280 [Iris pallida]
MMQLNFPRSPIPILNSNNYNSHYYPPLRARSRSRWPLPPLRSAVEKEGESEVEFDRARAREALQKLDQQLQSLSDQEALLKKTRPPSPYQEPNLERDFVTGRKRTDEMPEISGSYLAYSAVALLILTIFNNIVFNSFVKPSIDGPERYVTIERVPLSEPKYNNSSM